MKINQIYEFENRLSEYIGHWFYLNLTSLKTLYSGKNKIFITIDDPELTDFQVETFQLLSHKFVYTKKENKKTILLPATKIRNTPYYKKIPILKNYDWYFKVAREISKIPFFKNHYHKISFLNNFFHRPFIDPKDFIFLRELFEEALSLNFISKIKSFPKKIYIRRSGSHLLKSNTKNINQNLNLTKKTRQIINEDDLVKFLEKKGFFIVDTSEFHIGDKLLMFKNAETILSPEGGGLTYVFMCKKNTKICAITTKEPPNIFIDHYYDQSTVFNLNYYRFTNVKQIDEWENMYVDHTKLEKYLNSKKLI